MKNRLEKANGQIWKSLRLKIKAGLASGDMSPEQAKQLKVEQRKLQTRRDARKTAGFTQGRNSIEAQKPDSQIQFFQGIQHRYDLSKEAYLRMLVSQDSKCDCCKAPLVLFSSDRKCTPVVDHCHATGKVRALLCQRCNVLVGGIESAYHTDARQYLSRHQRSKTDGDPEH